MNTLTKKRLLLVYSLFFFFNLPACSEINDQTSAKDSTLSAENRLPKVFGPSVVLDERHQSKQWAGDFNGDGEKDTLMAVVIKENVKQFSNAFELIQPWPLNEPVLEQNDAAHKPVHYGLVLIHGGQKRPVLLYDANPVSILGTQAAQSLHTVEHNKISNLEEETLQNNAKGDVIVIPTEAGIDTYLYWNGETYRALEPKEVP